MAKVVFVVSGATYLILKDGTTDATGYWAEEFARPCKILTDAGYEVVVATPSGRACEIARHLIAAGPEVWIAARDPERGRAAAERLGAGSSS